ncbi:MAG: ABC transporter permease, partial [Longimicrobiales bacterium]
MSRLALWLIGIATPAEDRESVIGDTIERFAEVGATAGVAAARTWLRRETWRVLSSALRHRLAVRRRRAKMVFPRGGGRGLMSSIWQDVRHAVRWFRRSPGFTTVAVLTLAFGIGINTAMFAVVNAVMLKPLPFADADRLMLVHLLMPNRDGGLNETVWSYPKYRTLTEIQQEFENTALFRRTSFGVSGDGDPEIVPGEVITDEYFSVLGIRPILGRAFTADEAQRAGAAPLAAIGHGLWTRRYGASPDVVGRTVQIDGVAHTVVGVLPIGFKGLNGNAELWTPLAITDAHSLTQAHSHSYRVVARRRADVTESAAISALRVYGTRIYDAHYDARYDGYGGPGSNVPASATARSLYDSRLDADLRLAALIVLGAVACLLLIACVNLTNLLVAKSIARRREVAIRVALGAGRVRVTRQFVVEGLILAGAGAVAGLAVAGLLLVAAATLLPDANVFFGTPIAPGTPRIAGAAGLTRVSVGMIGFDAVTLGFTVGVAVLTAVLVSILPAFQASALRPGAVLKVTGGTASARGFGRFGSWSLLGGAQIALAMVLLAGAGLM